MQQHHYTRNQGLPSHPLYTSLINHLDECHGSTRDTYLGWGYKASGRWAQNKSRLKEGNGSRYFLLEDAFVRSIFPGYTGLPIYGIIADSSGIYYDYEGNTDLIHVLNGARAPSHWAPSVDPRELEQTLSLFRQIGASKYNCFSPSSEDDLSAYKKGVLVVDQTRGDAALKYGGIVESDFDRMLMEAIEEHPEQPIYVRAHPDHLHRKKNSCFSEHVLSHPRVQILPSSITPQDCFQFCDVVYVGTSLLGMEALLHGKKVHTYGWPFYSGWGLTVDKSSFPIPPRKTQLSVEQLFEAAYMRYSLYFHPETGGACSLKAILSHLQTQQKSLSLLPRSVSCFRFSPWKKHVMAKYLKPKSISIGHASKAKQLTSSQPVLVWGGNNVNVQQDIIRVEDGFIRSRGLGANFNFPLSWVFDDVGIYFDARSPSRLENILQHSQFSADELKQATAIKEYLCANKITKYNLGISDVSLPAEATGKKVILIPGQVDSDASIKYGSPKLKNNKELLEEVRAQQPDAYICYKPHPDLLSGARPDKPLWPGIENQVDHLVEQGDIISWIEAVDEVHTLTSTVGFEALMRNKPVFTYGLPFYAGWGLTVDWLDCERRTATRTLEELVYAVLIEYPTYLNPKTGEYTTALNAAKLLADPNFTYDARPLHIKLLAPLKVIYNTCVKRRLR